MALPIPKYPIDYIAIDHKPVYETLYADSTQHTVPCGRYVTEMRIAIAEEMSKAVFDALYAWGKAAGYIDDNDSPKPTKVIINDPATVVFFSDDTKTVTKAKDGDEYDPLFGIMACALRKVGKNRVRIDAWEPVIDFLSSYLADAKECRVIADMLNTTADALELDGVMDAMEECDVRNAEEPRMEWLTVEEFMGDKPRKRDASDVVDDITSALRDDYREKVRERTRQTIRSLVDRGEL